MKPLTQSSRMVLAVLCALLWVALPSQAAVQGDPGTTSSASLDVSLITGLGVRISGLNDMNLGTWAGVGDAESDDNLCIGRTGVGFFGSGSYRILASGNGEPGNPAAFTLSNGARSLYYNAFFNDSTGVSGRQPLIPGVALTSQNGSGFSLVLNYLFGCTAFTSNANVSIVIPEAELRGAAGVYTGTLTLILTPE